MISDRLIAMRRRLTMGSAAVITIFLFARPATISIWHHGLACLPDYGHDVIDHIVARRVALDRKRLAHEGTPAQIR
jgi:hypothetical protein